MSRPAIVPELYVSDLSASLAFYVALLGFRIAYERPKQRFAALQLADAHLMLEQAPSASRATAEEFRRGQWLTADLEPPFGRGLNLEIEVPDLQAVAVRLAAGGHPLLLEPHEKSYRIGSEQKRVRRLLVADPDGYLIRPSQPIRPATRNDPVSVRPFDPQRDPRAMRTCFVELQDFERTLDPGMPSGEAIADRYLARMFERCREFAGVVLVAEHEGAVVGFTTVWTRYRSSEPDDDDREHGFISDLVVLAPQRGRGIGRALLRAAEARAREAGVRRVRLSVKAGNAVARAMVAAQGFEDAELYLEKSMP